MPGLDCMLCLIAPLSLTATAPGFADLWAYVGLGPGQEFIPQFAAMLGLAATAMIAVVQWPLLALWSRLSRAIAARKQARTNTTSAAPAPEQPGENPPDRS
jgi:hypothetical protein